MGRKLSFLGFLTCLFVFAFSTNSFAGTCTYVYDSCNAGYYLNNDYCEDCPNGCTCAGGDAQPVCCGTETCPSGYTDGPSTYNTCNDETAQNTCYANCSWPCSGEYTEGCPDNATCTYDTSVSNNGVKYYGGSCSATNPGLCPVDTYTCDTGYEEIEGSCEPITCDTGEYLDGDDCEDCSNKPENSYYTGSSSEGDNCPWQCNEGYYEDNGSCVECLAGSYCTGGDKFDCPTSHPYSDEGNDSKNKCYADCVADEPAATMSGRDYYGATDTCEITSCEPGYYLAGGECVICPEGSYCDGIDEFDCPSSHPYSDIGNDDENKCYTDCVAESPDVTMTGRDYYGIDDTCEITACPDGQYLEEGECVECPAGSYCTGGERFDCPASHPYSDEGNSSKDMCYADCVADEPAATMSGRDYYGVANTCEITSCVEGYYLLENGTCVICPAGSYCDGTNQFDCSEKTNGSHPYSDLGAKEIGECYTYCQLASHATTMGGHDYYDDNLDNCVVVECEPDYYPNDAGTACVQGTHTCVAGKTENGANCPVGHYCPAQDNVAGDCEIACPADSLGGTVTTDGTGKANITDCYTTRTCVAVDGGAADRISYYLGTAANGSYSDDRKTTVTYCTAGYYRATDDATSCSPVGTGAWSPDRANQNTCSDANSLVRTLCSTLSGADATITTDTETSGSPAACYNTCPDELIVVDGEVIGKKVPAQEQVYYNGTTIPACTYPDNKIECEDGYTPSGSTCVPSVFTITLDHNCNNACTNTPASPIYLKYNTGWYASLADANAGTNPITSVNAPNWPGNTFSGYFAGATQVITANGGLTTNYKVFKANTTITAGWGQNDTITCPAGTYYSGTGTTCTDCPAGSYCEGTTVVQDTGQESGRTPCPAADSSNYTPAQTWNGTALVDVAPAVSSPVKSENLSACYATVQYTASKGKGSRICHYAAGKYESNCNGETILTCDSGHWLANQNDTDCSEVGKKHYSAQYVTTREDCPLYGTAYEARLDTETTTDAVVTKCMLNGVWKNVSHGGSTSRCHYVVATDDYSENCDSYTIRVCDAGYWDERQGAISEYAVGCVAVGDGYYSPAQSSCTGEPAQPIDILGCSTQRTACPGVDKYAGTVATDIASNAPATGTTTAASATACYLDCVAEKHTGGATQTVNNSPVHFNVTTDKYALCTYDIEGCGQGYELVDGDCEPCVRENALSYKDTGDCSVESCVIGYHPNNDQCEPDILDCTPQAPHATYAEQKWVASRGAYGICTIKSCEEGYHLASNACVLDEQVCEIEHGTGMKVWNYTTKSWGPCIATSCAAGYTNDPIEKNNASQQCSECRNKFSTLGEVAAQAYVTGCEIASCFYQGEKYNLDNNECVPICDQPYSDETGSLRWNERTKKCERTCNPGYVSW